jgi:class 3 adenylate cyclase/ligand-binding sensor domain-containing protein
MKSEQHIPLHSDTSAAANQQEADLRRVGWIKKIDITPVPERYRYAFAIAMFRQNFERMVIASKFGAVIMVIIFLVIDVWNLPKFPPEFFRWAVTIHVAFIIALFAGYLVGTHLNVEARRTPLWMFFAWGTFFRGCYTGIAYWMFYHMGQTQANMAGAYSVFVALITAGLYADKAYTLMLVSVNAAVYTIIVLATQHTALDITDSLYVGYCVLSIAAFSSSILYRSFCQEFAATKQIEEERRKAQELNAQLRDANEEINRQIEMLNEQSREIEISNTALQEKSLELAQERDTADALLHNILPRPIAQRLKAGERSIADKFDSVTVLFADIVGFTQIAATRPPAELVQMLNRVFSAFDIFSEQYNLEKIKTIGDAYMIVGGVPEPRADHCEAVAQMALEILSTIELLNKTLDTPLAVRIGMHTGAVVAGVIGQKKFSYDLWGDTVNTASRMESHSEAGRIHVTEEVFNALKGKCMFEERGEIEVKGKGLMRTWFLTGIRTVMVVFAMALSIVGFTPEYTKAQAPLDPHKRLSQYIMQAWTNEQGLPQNTVMTLAQTPDGYLWAGTFEGLVRYNGKAFTVFNRFTTPALQGNAVHELLIAPDSSLWIYTGDGLTQYAKGTFKKRLTKSMNYGTPNLFAWSDGKIWLVSKGKLGSFAAADTSGNPNITYWSKAQGLADDIVFSVHTLSSGVLLVCTAKGLNIVYSGKVFPCKQNPSGTNSELIRGEVIAIRPTSKHSQMDDIWILNKDNGIVTQYRTASVLSWEVRQTLPTQNEKMLFGLYTPALADNAGTLWVPTATGISRYVQGTTALFIDSASQGKSGVWVHNVDGEASVSYLVRAALEDREGTLWFGTNRGLWSLRNGKCTIFTEKEGLQGEYVRTLTVSTTSTTSTTSTRLTPPSYSIWAGTNKGLNRYANGLWQSVAIDSSQLRKDIAFGTQEILSLHETRSGTLWIGRKKGLFSLSKGKIRAYTAREGLSSDYVRAITSDNQGNIWLGTQNIGLTRYEESTQTFTDFTPKDGLASAYVIGMLEDSKGTLWVGCDGGLTRIPNYIREKKLLSYSAQQGFSSGKTFTFFEEPSASTGGTSSNDVVMWIGTNQGLFRWKKGEFRAIKVSQGLFDETVFRLLGDSNGNLWMSSNKGVAFARLRDLNDVADGTRAQLECTVFTYSDGMSNTQCNGATHPAGCKAPDGTLWFPTAKGISVFNPNRLARNTLPVPIVLEACLADNMTLPLAEVLTIPAGTKRVEFRFAGLSFITPERVRYRFFLEGFDQAWQDAGGKSDVFFTNLSPGRYTLHIKACNGDGIWNDTAFTATIVMEPFFYQTWWFTVLVVLLAGTSVWGVYRARVQYLTRKQHELEQTVQERTADIARQRDMLEEQAREIEIANTTLQEKNLIIEHEHALLEIERERSESLLLNVLPLPIALRLKSGERPIADKFDAVTVLFSDIVGFTKLSARISPQALVTLLDDIFTRFDRLVAKYGLEKIKTIGDAYMVVGGVPMHSHDHCGNVAMMALEMYTALEEFNTQHQSGLQVRIGIHTGEAVAGIIGMSKFAYDLWGDTVNTASRMESHGEPGKIHVSQEVYNALKGKCMFEERGEIEVKGKGLMRTWFLVNTLQQANVHQA